MELGYSFVWIRNSMPMLIAPDGARIELDVQGNVPILRVGGADPLPMVCAAVPRPIPASDDCDGDTDASEVAAVAIAPSVPSHARTGAEGRTPRTARALQIWWRMVQKEPTKTLDRSRSQSWLPLLRRRTTP